MVRSFLQREPDIASVLRDEDRLQALRRYQVCDTAPEPAFDRVARLAASLFDAPMALVNFIDGGRQWFKARVGIDDERAEVPFCVHTLARGRVCVVEDLEEAGAFATHPFVVDHDVQFYAGVPLIAPEGHRLGTLCVLDTAARSPSEERLERLEDLAAMVGDELARRRERAVPNEQSIDPAEKAKPTMQLEGGNPYQRLRLALEAAHAGTFEHDLDTGRVRWDERSLDVFGLESEWQNAKASRLEDLILDEDFDQVKGAFNRILEGTSSRYSLSYRIQRPDDGEVRHIRSRGIILRDEDGTAERIVGLNQDVTEDRQQKESLRRQKRLLEQAQKLAGAWEIDLQTEEVTWSEEVYRIHEVEPGTAVSIEEAIEFYAPEIRSRLREAFRACIDEGTPYDLELPIITAEGNRRWVRTVGAPAETEAGEVIKVAGAFQDITERKEVEEDLRHSREQLSMAVEGGNIGTWNWDLKTGEVIFNRRWAEMLGYTREELDFHFRTWEKLVHPDDLARAQEELKAYIRGKSEIYAPEIRMRTKAGAWKWIQTIGKVIERNEEGEVVRTAGIHLDIDDRKRAEEALREAKGRYQTLVEHFPDGGVFLFDDDLRYTVAGGEALDALDLSSEDIEGGQLGDLIPSSIAEQQRPYYRRALDGEKHVFEQKYEGRHYQVQTLPVRDDEGAVVSGMVVSQDVTERKQRERWLQQAETFFQNAQDALFLLDVEHESDEPTFSIQRVNPAYEQATGLWEDDIRGAGPAEIIGGEAAAYMEKMYQACVDRREPLAYEEEIPLDGHITHWTTRIAPVVVDGEVQQIVGTTRNVTERHRRKEALERQNDLFTKAENLADVGAWEYDVQTGEETLSPQACRIHGIPPGTELPPERSIQCYHPDDRSTIREAFTRALEEGASYDLELRLIREDGEQRWVHTRGEPQTEDGEVVRVRGVIQDITDRVHRRQELEAAKEAAEEADRMKMTLLSNVNHELRTPLTAILTFSKLIQSNPDVAAQFVDRIVNGGRRLLYTLNTVVELAKLESKTVSLDPTSLRLPDVVTSVVDEFREQVRDEPVDLWVDLPADSPLVELDETLTERVLTHLVHNAVKFTEEGSVGVAARMKADGVELTVTDTGIGIDPDFLPRVFDEFAQASSGCDRSYEGNGIGLTVVQRIVEHMGGTVDIESTPGEGTEVTVRLPVD